MWKVLGFICLAMAYVGIVTPGIPFSIFVVASAYCFAKGSPKMHAWLYSHPKFGPFLTNWTEKRIFPTRLKYMMVLTMSSSALIMFFTIPLKGFYWSVGFMFLVAVWAWRFPGSIEEFENRKIK